METPRLPQSNVAALPPPAAAAVALPSPQNPAAPLAPLPSAHPRPRATIARRQLRLPGRTRMKAGTRAVAAAVGPCLAEALRTRWRSYREELRKCQEEFSEEAVHELRVATRRLIAQLLLLSCVIRSASIEKARRILKRRLVALGELRDIQVQRTFISHEVARFPELDLMHKWLKRRERRLVKSAIEEVGRFKTKKLEKWVCGLIRGLGASAPSARLQDRQASAVLRATANAFAEAVERRRAIDLADLRTVHQTRVAFKRFRYMVESLSPGITALSKRQLRALAYYQRKMGIIQDLEVLQVGVGSYLEEHKKAEAVLRPFGRYLRQRRTRALRSFLKSADRLFGFWPPARLIAASDLAATRNAA
jgi:CHAD domain-containing protein